jgi:integrase/recombinase XerD
MLELFYSTGLRVSEVTALDVADVDLADAVLAVRRGKGGKGRRIPVGAAACQWVGRYLRDARPQLVRKPSERHLFLSTRGHPLSRGDVAKIFRTIVRAAGLRIRVTPHTMRHTFATHMLRGKASLRHVQEMLGHALLSTTQIYTRVDISDLKDVHRRCHPRGRG